MTERDPILRSVHATLCKLAKEGKSSLVINKKVEGGMDYVGASNENFNFTKGLTQEQVSAFANKTGHTAHIIKYDLLPFLLLGEDVTSVRMDCDNLTVRFSVLKGDTVKSHVNVILHDYSEAEMNIEAMGVPGSEVYPQQFLSGIHFVAGLN